MKSSSSLAFLNIASTPILPQAVCTRYALTVGAAMAPLFRFLLLLFFPLAYPVSIRLGGCSFCILDIEKAPIPDLPSNEEAVGVITTEDVIKELLRVQMQLLSDGILWPD
uniref:CNNM transmembrane domain-containing protein n=1 Tax=Salix viminalis TaxID=40686 RepID=A0A6N2KHJ9_SALVM